MTEGLVTEMWASRGKQRSTARDLKPGIPGQSGEVTFPEPVGAGVVGERLATVAALEGLSCQITWRQSRDTVGKKHPFFSPCLLSSVCGRTGHALRGGGHPRSLGGASPSRQAPQVRPGQGSARTRVGQEPVENSQPSRNTINKILAFLQLSL